MKEKKYTWGKVVNVREHKNLDFYNGKTLRDILNSF